jgi:transposase
MKIEVLGIERRRRWSLQDKLQIVEETMQPGVTVTEVARRHGLAPSVVFTWRRLAREGRLGDAGPAFMPVEITPVSGQTAPVASPPRRTGLIEIVLGRERRIRVDRDVDAEALLRVLQVVESLS